MQANRESSEILPPRYRLIDVSYTIGGAELITGVSFDVRQGEVLLLVGPNGAGKSTLLQLLSGDLTASAGTIELDGEAIGTYGAHDLALKRAVLPQQSFLQFAFTVREVVAMGRSPHDDDAQSRRTHVDRALNLTEMMPLADRIYPSLSGGERARAQLTRVVAQSAPLLLLDEPTAALDLRHQQHVMDLARQLADEGGTVIAVVHDLNLAASSADRILMLHRGRIVADGSPWEVMDEALLSDVYSHPIAVGQHPLRSCPLIMPLRREAAVPIA